MHSLLRRQLKRHFDDSFDIPKEWEPFIEAVNEAYQENDIDRGMLERSLELSSQELLHSNSEMRAVIQALPDILFRLSVDGTILGHKTGFSSTPFMVPENYEGKRIQDIYKKVIGDRFGEAIRHVYETRSLVSFEYQLEIRGKDEFYEARLVPLLEDQVFVIIRDMTEVRMAQEELQKSTAELALANALLQMELTEHRRDEEELRKSFSLLRATLESTADGILAVDSNGKITGFNSRFAQLWRLPDDILAAGDDERALAYVLNQLKDPEGFLDKVREIYAHLEDESFDILEFKDGRVFERYSQAQQIAGGAVGRVWSFRDITERRRSEEALRESEKRIRDITSSLGEGIYVFDINGVITFMNPTAERLLGWTMEELNEKGAHDLIHFQRADGTPLPFAECGMYCVIKSGEIFSSTDEVFVRKDGTVFPVSVITSPIIKDGRVVESVSAFRDITVEKKLEAELLKTQKLESIGVLAGGIAHDFNNLLQAILGNISVAKFFIEHAPKRIPPLLDNAIKASIAAKELSARLLTFSKGGEPFRRIASIEGILRESISLSLSGSNVTCDMILPPDLHLVEIDEKQMTQVFNNILINAKEAIRQGGTISIGAKNVSVSDGDPFPLKKGDYLRISIRDKGIGIPVEILPKIFDPYFTTKEMGSQKGTGLGLAVSLSIVKKHGGHIDVESGKGKGTTFHIYIPAVKTAVHGWDQWMAQPKVSRKRLLFMDDDEGIGNLVGNMVEYLGYEIKYAQNGEEAIEIFKQAKESGEIFDAVILDLTVHGGMGGDEAIKKLLEIDPGVKAVISSGYADDLILKDFRKFGFVDAIAKPYTMEQLKGLLNKLGDKTGG